MRLMERAHATPNELTGAADALVIGEGSLDDVGLLDLGMLMHRQGRARLPFQEASHLTLLFVLVEHLDRDAVELRWLPSHVLGLDIHGSADRGLCPAGIVGA